MRYLRAELEVEAIQYKPGKGLEDGFEQWSKLITNGWINTDGLIRLTKPNGSVVCPFIQNRRGVIFLQENDYIICEADGERHVCSAGKFSARFRLLQ